MKVASTPIKERRMIQFDLSSISEIRNSRRNRRSSMVEEVRTMVDSIIIHRKNMQRKERDYRIKKLNSIRKRETKEQTKVEKLVNKREESIEALKSQKNDLENEVSSHQRRLERLKILTSQLRNQLRASYRIIDDLRNEVAENNLFINGVANRLLAEGL